MTVAELIIRLLELPSDAKVKVYEDGIGDYEEVVRARYVNDKEVHILDWGTE